MNEKNLHTLIDRYEENYFTIVNSKECDEIFKWRAVQRFQREWFAAGAEERPFSELFRDAQKETSLLINNSVVSPTNGIIKLAEKEPEAVEYLFREVLFSDDGGDISLRYDHMEEFLEEIEKLRIKHFPRYYKYKQDRHAVSCYLAMFSPETNYIYRFSEAELFARCIEFGKDIGMGKYFSLEYYYEMCDAIVEALKQHSTLIEKYNHFLDSRCYPDQSLHIMAFDLIYCTRTYGFYAGLNYASKKRSIEKYTQEQLREKEKQKIEEQYQMLLDQEMQLEQDLSRYLEISLVNVEITSAQYGRGVVIGHNDRQHNMIIVQFDSCVKNYRLHNDVWPMMRPKFEDDSKIIQIMTEYETIWKKLKNVRTSIDKFA